MGSSLSKCIPFHADRAHSLILVGLDSAGKTTWLYRLRTGEHIDTVATPLSNPQEEVSYKNVKLQVWDLGGQYKYRRLWKLFYHEDTKGIVFAIDSSDRQRVDEARKELFEMLEDKKLEGAIVLVLANKQDVRQAMSAQEVAEAMALSSLGQRRWFVQPTSAIRNEGISEAMDWVIENIVPKDARANSRHYPELPLKCTEEWKAALQKEKDEAVKSKAHQGEQRRRKEQEQREQELLRSAQETPTFTPAVEKQVWDGGAESTEGVEVRGPEGVEMPSERRINEVEDDWVEVASEGQEVNLDIPLGLQEAVENREALIDRINTNSPVPRASSPLTPSPDVSERVPVRPTVLSRDLLSKSTDISILSPSLPQPVDTGPAPVANETQDNSVPQPMESGTPPLNPTEEQTLALAHSQEALTASSTTKREYRTQPISTPRRKGPTTAQLVALVMRQTMEKSERQQLIDRINRSEISTLEELETLGIDTGAAKNDPSPLSPATPNHFQSAPMPQSLSHKFTQPFSQALPGLQDPRVLSPPGSVKATKQLTPSVPPLNSAADQPLAVTAPVTFPHNHMPLQDSNSSFPSASLSSNPYDLAPEDLSSVYQQGAPVVRPSPDSSGNYPSSADSGVPASFGFQTNDEIGGHMILPKLPATEAHPVHHA